MRTDAPAARRGSGLRFSLQAKVQVLISAVITLVFMSAIAGAMYLIHSDRRTDLVARAEFLADVQSAGIARPIWDFELGQAASMLETLTRDPDFHFAAVEGADGKEIAAFGKPLGNKDTAVFAVNREIIHDNGGAGNDAATRAAKGTEQVNTNIGGVSRAASQTGEAATRVLTASRDVSQQADSLFDSVERFLTEIRAG